MANKSKAELKKELEKVKDAKFMLAMKDHWSGSDYDTDRKYSARIAELEKELGIKHEMTPAQKAYNEKLRKEEEAKQRKHIDALVRGILDD